MARLGTATSPIHLERQRVEQLVRTVEINLGKLADPDVEVSLDLIERLERALHNGHLANVLRIDAISARVLVADEVAAG